MKKYIFIAVFLFFVGAGAGFFAGIKYQQSKRQAFRMQSDGDIQPGTRMFTGDRNTVRLGFRPVNGEIINLDEKSLTVKLNDGSSKIILLTDKTNINKPQEVPYDELIEGIKIVIFGQENSDGSITAENIQL